MSEAQAKIVVLEHRVMWRERLLSLQDGLALALTIGALVAAALVLVVRLRPIELPSWTVVVGVMGLSFAAALTRAFITRGSVSDAAFLIDESLKLDDRVATSQLIIDRGGPKSALEEALIEDAAERLGNHRAASVVSFRVRRWYPLSLISLLGLVATLMISARPLPVADALVAERADIEGAGEHLEQSATEVEQAVPPGSETQTLAREQAELGRGFRRSPATRTEALKRLSSLEERIRRRRDDLAGTHADEIVSLADRRLGGALSTLSKTTSKKNGVDERTADMSDRGADGDLNRESNKEDRAAASTGAPKANEPSHDKAATSRPATPRTQSPTQAGEPEVADAKANGQNEPRPHKRPQEPVPGQPGRVAEPVKRDSKKDAGDQSASADQEPSEQKPGAQKGVAEQNGDPKTVAGKVDQQPTEQPKDALEALKAVPNSLAAQAAKALPRVSEQLLKKAAELRTNKLSPADIEKLRKAAEALSRDLPQIAQSKDLQQALQDMARQVRPEQIEQVARELGNQEKLKQELEAAARLLAENQQAKEMVAGLKEKFARDRDERRRLDGGQPDGDKSNLRDEVTRASDQAARNARTNAGAAPRTLTPTDRLLAGQGRESSLKGKLQQGSGGEYLYLQSKAGAGAARVLYSSAYPQYRREAERSVQRTQVPPTLRAVVRKYFDSINPDAKR